MIIFDHTGSEIIVRLKIQYMYLVHILWNITGATVLYWSSITTHILSGITTCMKIKNQMVNSAAGAWLQSSPMGSWYWQEPISFFLFTHCHITMDDEGWLHLVASAMATRMTSPIEESENVIVANHFYPRPVLVFGYCRCLRLSVCVSVCVCGNHMLVRAITHHPFELGSPNLDHRCKRPWLRSLLFWGVIDLDLQGQI